MMTQEELEAKVAALTKKVERLTRLLDETRRRVNLSSIIDEQTLAIYSRVHERGVA